MKKDSWEDVNYGESSRLKELQNTYFFLTEMKPGNCKVGRLTDFKIFFEKLYSFFPSYFTSAAHK